MKRAAHKKTECSPDIEETKGHVLAAGRELMLAAQGALAFCRDYAKSSSSSRETRSQLMKFFSKAMDVADELAKGLVSASHVPGAARGAADRVFDAIGREMKEQEEHKKKERAAKRRRPCRRNTRRS